jgi:hypothetical protein
MPKDIETQSGGFPALFKGETLDYCEKIVAGGEH